MATNKPASIKDRLVDWAGHSPDPSTFTGEELVAFLADCSEAADALPVNVEITWPYTYTLRQPRVILGDAYSELTLREPTTDDFVKFGLFDGDIDGNSWMGLISALSGKALPIVKAIPGLETLTIVRRLSGFFSQAAR